MIDDPLLFVTALLMDAVVMILVVCFLDPPEPCRTMKPLVPYRRLRTFGTLGLRMEPQVLTANASQRNTTNGC